MGSRDGVCISRLVRDGSQSQDKRVRGRFWFILLILVWLVLPAVSARALIQAEQAACIHGTLDSDVTLGADTVSNTGVLSIGRDVASGCASGEFLIDDLRIYAGAIAQQGEALSGLSCRYTYGLDLISQTRLEGGTPETRYYGYDGHGSVRTLIDASSGTITDSYDYDGYGMLLSSSSGSTPNNYRYSGEQWDQDLGAYYLRARYYSPQTGRFWTMDTFEGNSEDPLRLHKYLYAANNPVNNIDPSGHDLIGLMANFYVKAQLGAFTAFTTYGALTETVAFATALSMLNSAQLLSTGIDPETGQGATAMATAFAEVDFLPAGKLITKPLKASTKLIYRRAALDIWDSLSKVSRAAGQVHHRIPLEWAHLFPNMNPNRISNLKLVPRDIHEGVDGVSAAWTNFRNSLGGRTPTAQEVLDKATEIDTRFGQHFKDLE